jgi:hypothetical protein
MGLVRWMSNYGSTPTTLMANNYCATHIMAASLDGHRRSSSVAVAVACGGSVGGQKDRKIFWTPDMNSYEATLPLTLNLE